MKCHETEKKIQKKMIHVCSLFLAHPPLLISLALWAIFTMMKMIWWTLLIHQAACVELSIYHHLHCVSYLKFVNEKTDIAKLNLPWVLWLITDGDGTGLTVSSPLLFDYIHPLHSVTPPPTCQDHVSGISNASYFSILCGLTLRTNPH